jgi:hypothetical protein
VHLKIAQVHGIAQHGTDVVDLFRHHVPRHIQADPGGDADFQQVHGIREVPANFVPPLFSCIRTIMLGRKNGMAPPTETNRIFFDAEWKWHKHYYPKMKGKKVGLITVCGDSDVSTANPIVHSFKTTCQFAGIKWLGLVQASATEKGEIDKNERAKKRLMSWARKGLPPPDTEEFFDLE